MDIKFTQEKRGEIERIQREFRDQLSESKILKLSSTAINGVLKSSRTRLKKQVSLEYNITKKYMDRLIKVDPYSTPSSLWGGIQLNVGVLPLIAFKPKQRGSSVYFSTRKGKPAYMRNSFITTVRGTGGGGPHEGVFSRGHYDKNFIPGRETTRTGKVRITQIMGVSAFTMGTNKTIAHDVSNYMGDEVMKRVHGILTDRVKKIANQNK